MSVGKWLRSIVIVVVIVLIGIVALGIVSRVNEKVEEIESRTVVAGDDTLIIPDFHHSEYDGTLRTWELRANEARFKDLNHALLIRPLLEVNPPEGRKLKVSSREGDVDLEKKQLQVRGSVTAEDDRGYRLTTTEANYDGGSGVIWTDKGFSVDGPDLKGTGKKLTIYSGKRRLKIDGGVDLIIYPTGEKDLS